MTEKKQEIVKKDNGVLKNTFADSVMTSINKFTSEKRLVLPTNYSAENSLKSAWLKILETTDRNGKKALEVCTPESVGNALLEMAIMGLNPSKSQCYFIVYGNKLTMFPSYFGKITALKRIKGIEGINAQAIYEGDTIDYDINEDGAIINIEHHQEFKNIKEDQLVGAYCVIKYNGQNYGTIVTMEQIQQAWNKSKTSKDKKEFKSEFAKRTAVNRAIKWFINTRDDEDLLIETISANENSHYDFEDNQEDMEEVPTRVVVEANFEEEKQENEASTVEVQNDTQVPEFV